ncbi:hypothetical protein ABFA07_009298 [Porites harrisoni]
MKPTILMFILVIFGLFDCCWARKKDPEHALLDGNRAKNFLLHRRLIKSRPLLRPSSSLLEECCHEKCDAEEVRETFGSLRNPERSREKYIKENC